MKKIVILLLVLLSKIGYSQVDTLKVNLDTIAFNKKSLKNFLEDNFISFNASKRELLESNHPISLFKFNMVVKNSRIVYSLMSSIVTNMYAYVNLDGISFYIIADINYRKQLDEFVEKLGYPWNVTKEDYRQGNFDMLLWKKDDLQIAILNNFGIGKEKNSKIIQITDQSLNTLYNTDPWE